MNRQDEICQRGGKVGDSHWLIDFQFMLMSFSRHFAAHNFRSYKTLKRFTALLRQHAALPPPQCGKRLSVLCNEVVSNLSNNAIYFSSLYTVESHSKFRKIKKKKCFMLGVKITTQLQLMIRKFRNRLKPTST